jgi:hypothetical protein
MRHEPGSEGVPDVPPADGITDETPGSAPGTAAGG